MLCQIRVDRRPYTVERLQVVHPQPRDDIGDLVLGARIEVERRVAVQRADDVVGDDEDRRGSKRTDELGDLLFSDAERVLAILNGT